MPLWSVRRYWELRCQPEKRYLGQASKDSVLLTVRHSIGRHIERQCTSGSNISSLERILTTYEVEPIPKDRASMVDYITQVAVRRLYGIEKSMTQ